MVLRCSWQIKVPVTNSIVLTFCSNAANSGSVLEQQPNSQTQPEIGKDEAAVVVTGMYDELKQASVRARGFIKFARDKAHRDIARVKLIFCNNSRRQIEWSLKCSNNVIQAIPKAYGLIKEFDSNECTLVWQRPKGLNSWREMMTVKMMLSVKLIKSENGKVVGEAVNKFRAAVDPDALCTENDPPIHKLVLNSERAPKKSKSKRESKKKIKTKTAKTDSLRDSQTTYWLFVFILCLLVAFLLKNLSERDDRNR